jgi:DNA polymerase
MPASPPLEPGFPPEVPHAATLEALRKVLVRCTRCDLFRTRTQVVPGEGNPRARVYLLGEAPGATEDRLGRPFVGKSGQLLDEMLPLAGLAREEVFISNVVRSRPPQNRGPRAGELRACAGWTHEQIRLTAPEFVVTLGRFALQYFIPQGRITQLKGERQNITYDGRALTLFPLLHPSAVLRTPALRPEYAEHFRALGEVVKGMK